MKEERNLSLECALKDLSNSNALLRTFDTRRQRHDINLNPLQMINRNDCLHKSV